MFSGRSNVDAHLSLRLPRDDEAESPGEASDFPRRFVDEDRLPRLESLDIQPGDEYHNSDPAIYLKLSYVRAVFGELTSGRSRSDPSDVEVLNVFFVDFGDNETFNDFLKTLPLMPALRELYVICCKLSDDKGSRLFQTLNDFNPALRVLDLRGTELGKVLDAKGNRMPYGMTGKVLGSLNSLVHRRLTVLDLSENGLSPIDYASLGASFLTLSEEVSQLKELNLGCLSQDLVPVFSRSESHSLNQLHHVCGDRGDRVANTKDYRQGVEQLQGVALNVLSTKGYWPEIRGCARRARVLHVCLGYACSNLTDFLDDCASGALAAETLIISRSPSDMDWKSFGNFVGATNCRLKVLAVHSPSDHKRISEFFIGLSLNSTLARLVLKSIRLRNEGLHDLLCCLNNVNLSSLDLTDNEFDDGSDIAEWLTSPCSSGLKSLCLGRNSLLGSHGASLILQSVMGHPSIEYVDLSNCCSAKRSLELRESPKRCSALKILDLSLKWCEAEKHIVSIQGNDLVPLIKSCPKLETVDVSRSWDSSTHSKRLGRLLRRRRKQLAVMHDVQVNDPFQLRGFQACWNAQTQLVALCTGIHASSRQRCRGLKSLNDEMGHDGNDQLKFMILELLVELNVYWPRGNKASCAEWKSRWWIPEYRD